MADLPGAAAGAPGTAPGGSGAAPDPGDPAPGQVRARLLAARAAAAEQAQTLARELEGLLEAAVGVAADDEHDPEGATLAFERAQLTAVLGQARRHLAAVEEALARLGRGEFGLCRVCRGAIGADRLAARPTADTCVSCAGTRR